ncbi:MAG: lipid II flippase MurJ [Candidatus Eisenbacteria bacterium]
MNRDARPEGSHATMPELSGLLRAGLWISTLTIASKGLGLIREGVLAWAFGTSGLADAFRVSQTGVFLLIHLLAGSVLDSAFLPTFKHMLSGGHPRLAWLTVRLSGRVLAVAGILLCVLLWLFAPVWVGLLAPGFDEPRRELTVQLLRAMALTVPLGLLVNLSITVATGLYRFRVPPLRVVIQNGSILLGIVLTISVGSVMFLGMALPFAQAVMLLLLIPVIRPLARASVRGTAARRGVAWRHLRVAMAPGLALVALEQAAVLVERIVASRLPEGSIASLDYARFLVETPMVTIGLGMAQVMLPALADLSAGRDRERLDRSARAYLIGALWGVFPIAIWLFVCGEDLVRILYQRGAFDEQSVRTTTEALFGFTLGLWAWFGGTVVLQKLLYAQRRLRPLIPLTAVSLGTFLIAAWTLAATEGVRGVALAFSLSQIVYFAGALVIQGRTFARAALLPLLHVLGGALALGWALRFLPELSPIAHAALGLLCVVLGWILWTLPSREMRGLADTLFRRLFARARS